MVLEVGTDPSAKVPDEAVRLDLQGWSSDTRHDRHMFIPGANRPIS